MIGEYIQKALEKAKYVTIVHSSSAKTTLSSPLRGEDKGEGEGLKGEGFSP